MILLVLALALNDAQQAKHDDAERIMYARLQADDNAIAEIWRPKPELLSDYRAARRCYTQFHLYKVDSCDEQLDRVDRDLHKVKE